MKRIKTAGAWLICLAALAMVGCSHNAQNKVILDAALATASGYRTLGIVDKQRQLSIRRLALTDAREARAAFDENERRYDVAKAALDEVHGLVESAANVGFTVPLITRVVAAAVRLKAAIDAYQGGGP